MGPCKNLVEIPWRPKIMRFVHRVHLNSASLSVIYLSMRGQAIRGNDLTSV